MDRKLKCPLCGTRCEVKNGFADHPAGKCPLNGLWFVKVWNQLHRAICAKVKGRVCSAFRAKGGGK